MHYSQDQIAISCGKVVIRLPVRALLGSGISRDASHGGVFKKWLKILEDSERIRARLGKENGSEIVIREALTV
jgi:hypothetical protein